MRAFAAPLIALGIALTPGAARAQCDATPTHARRDTLARFIAHRRAPAVRSIVPVGPTRIAAASMRRRVPVKVAPLARFASNVIPTETRPIAKSIGAPVAAAKHTPRK